MLGVCIPTESFFFYFYFHSIEPDHQQYCNEIHGTPASTYISTSKHSYENNTIYTTDRHSQNTNWMRIECPALCKQYGKQVITHFFDRWHVAKSK